ncbi:replication initiation protein [Clostridium estertheticum]|uniref:RepB family plasmid replication initiator protein n=1 Tax=Clostridium estertheticum TaxID=238834 RepID=A0A7Y3WTT5_9CLOT|nr:RepB family plasmid replication initiator protein [Clostridium estertheticum]MBW9173996.1 RepB family plasmid replication initiator protein [Clostridium estertheticum]NNU78537.1 RepB family plasmid replication initiator protein [Clostridium estertheticum]WBL49604.1 RepB family plasmid replication initiator protein [Clostridium estertheticum]WLC77834.1 RepB family plasmid replication initiator protein [Clostridium estertheticum]
MIKKGKYIAVRPNELIEARYNLSVSQNDIMDMVLTKIEDDNNYLYELNINDYKHLYKTDTSNIYRNLEKATKGMEGTGFYLLTNNDKGVEKETFFVWFASIEYVKSEGKITFEIGTKLKALLLEMKKRIYYKIEYPMNFSSIYSKRVYYYLKSFEDTGWRIDNLDVLRKKLQCPKSYEKYSFFRIKVLDMAIKEINNYSDISFEFQEIKLGRKVMRIKFIIKQNQNNKARNEIVATSLDLKESEELGLIKQVQEIFTKNTITRHEASCILKDANNNIDLINQCYQYLLTKDVPNVVGYMRTLVKGFNEPQANIHESNFTNYEQRTYDFDSLEKKLLGWGN